jgi:hypothetical protein
MSNEWHRTVTRSKLKGGDIDWKGIEVPNWHYTGKDDHWKIVQIVSSRDLFSEGRKQRHCVASYVSSCIQGRTAIFSLRRTPKDNPNIFYRCVTLQVNIALEGLIQLVQARRRLNAPPRSIEKGIIRRWASARSIQVSAWCL